jgi:asparagine synthase (glutamine-hydrolysing)
LGKGKIPDSILNRSKQAYRAPIASSFLSINRPHDYISEILSESTIKDFGLFDTKKVLRLLEKLKGQTVISEMDQMAVAGIISTQLMQKMFVLERRSIDTSLLANVKIVKEMRSDH